MSYLVIAAHPDDEVLGCGGSIAKWSQKGNDVHILIMAEGATSRDVKRDPKMRDSELLHLKKMGQKSSVILGAKSIEFIDFPDNRMDSVEFLDIVKSIESHIKRVKPSVVVTHHLGDLNIDHQLIHKAVITACRPQPGSKIQKIISFEVSSSTDWQSTSNGIPFLPNYFEDVSEFIDLKLKALKVYKSEMRDWPHSRSIKAIKKLMQLRGSSVGLEAAEAFVLLRLINE